MRRRNVHVSKKLEYTMRYQIVEKHEVLLFIQRTNAIVMEKTLATDFVKTAGLWH